MHNLYDFIHILYRYDETAQDSGIYTGKKCESRNNVMYTYTHIHDTYL